MSDDNKIKGPGYYPKRPGKTPEPVAPIPAPVPSWFGDYISHSSGDSFVCDLDLSVLETRIIASQRVSADRLRESFQRARDQLGWTSTPRVSLREYETPVSNRRTPVHNPSQAAHPGEQFWLFTQRATPRLPLEYSRIRGISTVVLVEAHDASHAERILERVVQFDGARWRRQVPIRVGVYSHDGGRNYPNGTFVHRNDGQVIEEITDHPGCTSEEEPNR